MWVLARSKALKYPQLVPDVRFEYYETANAVFLPSEQILLSLALFQLFQIKISELGNYNGRYSLVSQYFLPNKSANQICNHLKNVRSSSSTPIHKIITVLILILFYKVIIFIILLLKVKKKNFRKRNKKAC